MILTWASIIIALSCFAIPGFLLLLFLNNISKSERIIFSFPVGVIIVSLAMYFLNNLGMPITRMSLLIVIVVLSSVLYAVKWKMEGKNGSSNDTL